MKITITPLAGSGATTPFMLADDTVAELSGSAFPNGAGGLIVMENGFVPEMSTVTQSDELINSTWKQELSRANSQMSYTFMVNRNLNNNANVLVFLRDHFPLIPLVGTLAITEGGSTAYLTNAVLINPRCTKQSGRDFTIQYTYRGSYVAPIYGGGGTGTGGPFTASS
jgi:hypothetical protein